MSQQINHSEAEVKRAVCDYLDAKKYLYVPIQNAGIWNPKGFRQTFKGTKGAPDLMVFDHNNKEWICIELKGTIGKQSKAQELFEGTIDSLGGKYFIVRDINDLQDIGL